MDHPTYREKSTMTTLSDSLTSQLQMYINNNVVQSHINICSSNMKPEFLYDNLLDCSSFNNKPIDYNKPINNGEANTWDYNHHGFPFGRCITCPIVSSPSTSENDKDINFSLLRNIATHIKARTVSEVMYKCGHCKASFEEKYDFVNHMKVHMNEMRPISENSCNMVSPVPLNNGASTTPNGTIITSVTDNSNNTGNGNHPNPSNNNSTSTSANNNSNSNNSNSNNNNNSNSNTGSTVTQRDNGGANQCENAKRFVCECCNTSYSRKSNLNAHMRSHSDGRKPFACDYCEASYSRKANLNTHVKLHKNDVKPFRCNMCEAVYSGKSSLDAHIRIHTDNTKPFRCDFCGATYSRKTNLNAHVKIHTIGRQPFTCEFCNASYSRKTNLNAHVRTHTSGKISYKCEYCSVQYSRKTNLNTHVRTHTGEKPYKCKQCTQAFSRRTDLNTHMKNHPSSNNTVDVPPPPQPSTVGGPLVRLAPNVPGHPAVNVEMNKPTYQPQSQPSMEYLVPKRTSCTYEPNSSSSSGSSNSRQNGP